MCPQNWTWKYPEGCEYKGLASDWYSDGNWMVYVEEMKECVPLPLYTYEEAKNRCGALGATLVREQDVLDAVRL